MVRKKILFICGSLNQTTMMHQIAMHLPETDQYFTPYYADGFLNILAQHGLLDFSILGGRFRQSTEEYLRDQHLAIDYQGTMHEYDLVVTCQDLVIPRNIRSKPLILVQEGMTDPENVLYYLVKWLKLPRYLASTSTTGLSDAYDLFCVASEGYRDLFIRKGVQPEKLVVTGIPNFDNCKKYLHNDFPYKNYVLVATSDSRETFKYENRKKFIQQALEIAAGKQIIFKLHPNEHVERATKEIMDQAPDAIVFSTGNTNHMIANCDVLVTRFSTVVYVGISLGKEVYSEFDTSMLRRLTPLQNDGMSARNIAQVCRCTLHTPPVRPVPFFQKNFKQFLRDNPRGFGRAFSLLSRKFGA